MSQEINRGKDTWLTARNYLELKSSLDEEIEGKNVVNGRINASNNAGILKK